MKDYAFRQFHKYILPSQLMHRSRNGSSLTGGSLTGRGILGDVSKPFKKLSKIKIRF